MEPTSTIQTAPRSAPCSIRVGGAHGLSLHALAWSERGVALLLVHGFGNDAHVWDDAAPALAPYYRTLALDLRGHGDSDRDPEGRYDYDAHVADLEAATAALGIERLVLVGHSLGGRVAMLFAGAHPERMAGLVIVDSAPELDGRGTLRIQLDVERGGGAPGFGSEAEYRALLARAYPAARPETLARMARHGLRTRSDGRLEPKLDPNWFRLRREASEPAMRERELRTTRALWDALARVPCPTLVIRGAASDVLDPDVAERMVEEVLAHGRLAVVPRAGHSVMVDNPEGFLDALAGFVLGDA
jgi:pimeloyl-ACP methyl ester carboxylesterase